MYDRVNKAKRDTRRVATVSGDGGRSISRLDISAYASYFSNIPYFLLASMKKRAM